ncbi:MAG: hypothetical protein GY749_11300 [Desulfobacteraceae bacterium]|nr:hypothetical protein [Desulfobacteraceae bacterium]
MKTGIIFKNFFSIFTLVLLTMVSASTNVSAADGDMDTSFGSGGLVSSVFGSSDDIGYSIAIQSDQKIIVAGESKDAILANSDKDFMLIRYAANGYPDTSFGTDGRITADFGGDDIGRSVAVQPDGKIVIAGYSETAGDFALARYTGSGTPDNTFGTDGKVTTDIDNFDACIDVAVQADGKIVAAGSSNHDISVVRYNTDGTLDSGFGTGGKVTTPIGSGDDIGSGLIIQADGKIVVTGFSHNGSDNDFAVVRYNTDGTPDTGFGTGGKVTTPIGSGDDSGYVGAIQSDGKIVVAGYTYNGSDKDVAVVRYNSDGSLDTSFGNSGIAITPVGSGDDFGYAACIQTDGKIVVTGEFHNGSDNDIAVMRYNSDGSPDTSFGTGGITTAGFEYLDDAGYAVAVQSDGNIVTAGTSDEWGAKHIALARYLSGNVVPAGPDEVKITAADGSAYDFLGHSVSISGEYAIMGSENHSSAYIFKRDGNEWNQHVKLEESGNYFGGSVSISGDYAIVGCKGDDDNGNNSGAAYIFKTDGTAWNQQTKLAAGDGSQYDYFGSSVFISGDYAIVAASGSAYIFMRDGITWNQQAKLTSASADDGFGNSVSISGDHAIIGASYDHDNGYYSGSAYIFMRDGTTWNQQIKLSASDSSENGCFGSSVSISEDYAIVGKQRLSAYIFKRDATGWNEQAKLINSDCLYNSFGDSVSISGDYAVVGNSFYGAAYVFKRDGNIWNKHLGLKAGNAQTDDSFGYSVDISGNDVIIGATGDDDNGSSSGAAYIYDLGPSDAEIYSPAPGLTLNSTSLTLKWNTSNADQYWLWVGTTGVGSKDLYSDDQGTDMSRTVYSLPNSGETLYVRLHSLVDGEWVYNDYTYTAYTAAKAEMQTPAPESVLTSASETFVWSDAGAEQYWLWVGTSPESNDVYSDSQGTNTSRMVAGLPGGGETLYVRLLSLVNGEWLHNDYTYTAYSIALAEMQSPVPESALSSTTETFTWSDAVADQYWLWVGTSPESNDVYSDSQGTNTSRMIAGLPGNGETLYVRLHSLVNGEWLYNDYTYTAYSISLAEMQSPVPESALSSTTETFTWSDAGADQYWLWIGTSPGGKDVYSDGQGTNTSRTIANLPDQYMSDYTLLSTETGFIMTTPIQHLNRM